MKAARETLGLSKDTDPVLAELVEEITNKIQSGEPVDLAAYERDHPEQIAQLQKLLPAIEMLAEMKDSPVTQTTSVQPIAQDARLQQGVIGDYRILREVGRGGMGVVYEAEQVSLGRKVALKVLPFAAVLDNRQLQRFKSEAQAAARLHHTHIVPVFSVGSERGVHYYAMQYIEGHPLSSLIRELRQLSGLDPLEHSQSAGAISEITSSLASGRFSPAKPQTLGGSSAAANLRIDSANSSLGLAPTGQSSRNPEYLRSVANLGVQAAEALEHAHRQGVVHRDVKPSNLLLDTQGHLWITDFGLAHCQTDTTHTLTMPGDLLGTIRYMSPEQALAKRVVIDHRTDVYSLGVTLYELLTLEPAYTGQDRQELMRQIAFEEPRPLRRLNEAIPPDLQTIVLKATEKNPDQRYETAQDVADDLRRFLGSKPILAKPPTLVDRGTKWCRRHRSVVGAAVALLVMSVIGLTASTFLILQEQSRTAAALTQAQLNLQTAEAQRLRAEENFQKARDAVDRMLTEAAEKLADVPHMEQVRRALLENALEFYEGFLAERSDDPEVLLETGRAYGRAAGINDMLGNRAEAEAHYGKSVEILEALVAESDDAEYRHALAGAYYDFQKLLWKGGRHGAAVQPCREALALFERLATEYPEEPKYRQELGSSLNDLAIVLMATAQRGEGEGFQQRSLTILKELAAEFPDEPECRAELARIHNNIGGESHYRSAVRLMEQLEREFPDAPGYQENLAFYLKNLGNALRGTAQAEEAEAELFPRSLALYKRLTADFPDVPGYRERMGQVVQEFAPLLVDAGRLGEAEDVYRQMVAVREQLIADFPNKPHHRQALNHAFRGMASLLAQARKADEATKIFQQALHEQEELIADYPENLDYREQLAITHQNFAHSLYEAGRYDEAEAHYQQAVEIQTSLVADAPQEPRYLKDLAFTYRRLGQSGFPLRRNGKTESAFQAAVAISDEILRRFNPTEQGYLLERAANHSSLAHELVDKGRLQEAEQLFVQAIAQYEQVAFNAPKETWHWGYLSVVYIRYGKLLADTGRRPQQAELFERAVQTLEKLVADYPEALEYRGQLAIMHREFANSLLRAGRHDEAKARYQHLIEIQTALVAEAPEEPRHKQELAFTYRNLFEDKEAAQRKAIEIQQALVADYPEKLAYREQLADMHREFGVILSEARKYDAAEQAYHHGIEVFNALISDSPDVPRHQRNTWLVHTYWRLGGLYAATDRLEEAELAYRQAVDLHEEILHKFDPFDPNVHWFWVHRRVSYSRLVELLTDSGRLQEAEQLRMQAVTGLEQLVAATPDVPEYRRELASEYGEFAKWRKSVGKSAQAEKLQQKRLGVLEKLVAEAPNVPAYRIALSDSYFELGELFDQQQRPQECIAAYRQALAVREQLTADETPEHLHHLANRYHELADRLIAVGRMDEAEAELDQALANREQLVTDFPNHEHRVALTDEYTYRGFMLAKAGNAQESHTWFHKAIELHAKLPLSDHYGPARCCLNLGILLYEAGLHTEARQVFSEDISILEKACAEDPDEPEPFAALAGQLVACPYPEYQDPARAAELARHAIQLAPQNGWWSRPLAMAHYRLGDWQASVEEGNRSFELIGFVHAWGLFYQAMAHWQLGNKDEARNSYEQAVVWMPTASWSHTQLNGELYVLRKEAASLLGIEEEESAPLGVSED